MTNIQIVCDSMTNLPQHLLDQYNVHIVPLTILIGDEEYRDVIDIQAKELYEILRTSDTLPKTSQASYANFKEAFDRYTEEGKTILYLGGSSVVSGTLQSALLAKSDVEEGDIRIFDTKNVSIGTGLFVLKAGQMIEAGHTVDEITTELERIRETVTVVFAVDTLEYLQKGGRVSMAKAAIGNVLNIKPILGIKDGSVVPVSQVRGKKKMAAKLVDLVTNEFGENLSGRTILLGCGDNEAELELLKEYMLEKTDVKNVMTVHIGACICAHSGPGVLGIACV